MAEVVSCRERSVHLGLTGHPPCERAQSLNLRDDEVFVLLGDATAGNYNLLKSTGMLFDFGGHIYCD